MKTTRILVTTFLMSIFCVAWSYAQQGQKSKLTPEERVAKHVEMMKKSLNLTDEQAVKLQEVQTQLFNDMKQVRGTRGTGEINREAMKAKREEMKTKREPMKPKDEAMTAEMKAKREAKAAEMKTKRDAYEAKLKTILTPEQYQKYQEQCKDKQKNMHKRTERGQKPGDHPKGERTKGGVKS